MSPAKKDEREEPKKGEKVMRHVSFPLSDEERAKLGDKSAKLEGEIESLEEKKKAEAKKWNDDIKHKRKLVRKYAKEITTGREERDVECVEDKDFEKKKVYYWYKGEVVAERAMVEADQQQDIVPLPGSKDKSAAPKRGAFQKPKKTVDKDETPEEKRQREINEVRKADSKNPARAGRDLQ